jgi:hypothetical protein
VRRQVTIHDEAWSARSLLSVVLNVSFRDLQIEKTPVTASVWVLPRIPGIDTDSLHRTAQLEIRCFHPREKPDAVAVEQITTLIAA